MVTRESVKQLRIDNPTATLQEIGDKVGLSRERVRQVLKTENLSTVHVKIEIINETEIPWRIGRLKYREIWESLKELKDGQALKISEINKKDFPSIRSSFTRLGHKVRQRNSVIYIVKGSNVDRKSQR